MLKFEVVGLARLNLKVVLLIGLLALTFRRSARLLEGNGERREGGGEERGGKGVKRGGKEEGKREEGRG